MNHSNKTKLLTKQISHQPMFEHTFFLFFCFLSIENEKPQQDFHSTFNIVMATCIIIIAQEFGTILKIHRQRNPPKSIVNRFFFSLIFCFFFFVLSIKSFNGFNHIIFLISWLFVTVFPLIQIISNIGIACLLYCAWNIHRNAMNFAWMMTIHDSKRKCRRKTKFSITKKETGKQKSRA